MADPRRPEYTGSTVAADPRTEKRNASRSPEGGQNRKLGRLNPPTGPSKGGFRQPSRGAPSPRDRPPNASPRDRPAAASPESRGSVRDGVSSGRSTPQHAPKHVAPTVPTAVMTSDAATPATNGTSNPVLDALMLFSSQNAQQAALQAKVAQTQTRYDLALREYKSMKKEFVAFPPIQKRMTITKDDSTKKLNDAKQELDRHVITQNDHMQKLAHVIAEAAKPHQPIINKDDFVSRELFDQVRKDHEELKNEFKETKAQLVGMKSELAGVKDFTNDQIKPKLSLQDQTREDLRKLNSEVAQNKEILSGNQSKVDLNKWKLEAENKLSKLNHMPDDVRILQNNTATLFSWKSEAELGLRDVTATNSRANEAVKQVATFQGEVTELQKTNVNKSSSNSSGPGKEVENKQAELMKKQDEMAKRQDKADEYFSLFRTDYLASKKKLQDDVSELEKSDTRKISTSANGSTENIVELKRAQNTLDGRQDEFEQKIAGLQKTVNRLSSDLKAKGSVVGEEFKSTIEMLAQEGPELKRVVDQLETEVAAMKKERDETETGRQLAKLQENEPDIANSIRELQEGLEAVKSTQAVPAQTTNISDHSGDIAAIKGSIEELRQDGRSLADRVEEDIREERKARVDEVSQLREELISASQVQSGSDTQVRQRMDGLGRRLDAAQSTKAGRSSLIPQQNALSQPGDVAALGESIRQLEVERKDHGVVFKYVDDNLEPVRKGLAEFQSAREATQSLQKSVEIIETQLGNLTILTERVNGLEFVLGNKPSAEAVNVLRREFEERSNVQIKVVEDLKTFKDQLQQYELRHRSLQHQVDQIRQQRPPPERPTEAPRSHTPIQQQPVLNANVRQSPNLTNGRVPSPMTNGVQQSPGHGHGPMMAQHQGVQPPAVPAQPQYDIGRMQAQLDQLSMVTQHLKKRYDNLTTDEAVKRMLDQLAIVWPHAKQLEGAVMGLQTGTRQLEERMTQLKNEFEQLKMSLENGTEQVRKDAAAEVARIDASLLNSRKAFGELEAEVKKMNTTSTTAGVNLEYLLAKTNVLDAVDVSELKEKTDRIEKVTTKNETRIAEHHKVCESVVGIERTLNETIGPKVTTLQGRVELLENIVHN
ncbi:hypothetical protein LTR09_003200 [Extremus antarcticus]|uniref:Uncharacterized protein n=1 Tax=Extremus antarcticus TaxID=702011 RepID=A0AAJ0LUT5_9PEZI|nr:hypothetical protein LTR09_003200 [Extremus antarcticus]